MEDFRAYTVMSNMWYRGELGSMKLDKPRKKQNALLIYATPRIITFFEQEDLRERGRWRGAANCAASVPESQAEGEGPQRIPPEGPWPTESLSTADRVLPLGSRMAEAREMKNGGQLAGP